MSSGTDLSSLWLSAADSSWCTYRGNIKYTSGGADCPAPDTSHLFAAFPPLPILWNVAFLTCITMEFHCIAQWCVLSFTCMFSRCCLQYASTSGRNYFSDKNWLLFFTSRNKRHTFTTPRILSFCTLYARQTIINCLLRHYSPTVHYLLQCWFSTGKRTGFAGNV